MSEEELNEEKAKLCETKDERIAREKKEADAKIADQAFYEQMKEEAAKEQATKLDGPPIIAAKAQAIVSEVIKDTAIPTQKGLENSQLRDIPPDIQMFFANAPSAAEELDGDWNLLEPLSPPKKQS